MSDIYHFDFDDDDDDRPFKRGNVICHTSKNGEEETPMFLIGDEIYVFTWADYFAGRYDARIVYDALKKRYEPEGR